MTSKNCFSRLLVGCTVVLVLSACGGGGGDGDGVTPATITKKTTLIIGQEVPAATPPAPANMIGGTMTITLTTATNAVSGTLTLTGDFARVTAAHIHDGNVGTAGGVVIGLVDGGNGSWSLPANAFFTAEQAARFKADGYYVNAHTALNLAGEIRGQLADNITKEASLTLGQEVPAANVLTPPVTAIGGTVTVILLPVTNAVSGTLTLTGDFARVTAAHIHDGDMGSAGGVVIGLVNGGNGSWSLPATATLTAAQAARFKAGGYYVNAHTAQNEAGEIRGQLLGFADNIQPIFNANCAVSTCHVTPSSSGAPMSLAAGASYGNLVNQPASVGTRVIPDNSVDSVLYKRITGTTAGPRMPPSPAPLLPANTQNLIKVWIDMGAKNN